MKASLLALSFVCLLGCRGERIPVEAQLICDSRTISVTVKCRKGWVCGWYKADKSDTWTTWSDNVTYTPKPGEFCSAHNIWSNGHEVAN